MDKESILEMSRRENKNSDLVGKSAELTASLFAGVSMAIMSLVFYAAQIAFHGTRNWGFFAIITLYNAVLNIIRGIKLSKKGVIVAGILWSLLTILLSVMHICTLIETSTL